MTDRHQRGMEVRRTVLGDSHVDRAETARTAFDAPFQDFITEGVWGSVWSSDRWTLRERSLVTLALLAGLGNFEEFALHVRATANTGASPRGRARDPDARRHLCRRAARQPCDQGGAGDVRGDGGGAVSHEYVQRDRRWHPPALIPDYKNTVTRSPRLPRLSVENSLSEITGPTFSHAALGELDHDLIHNHTGGPTVGERTIVHGWVTEESGRPVPGALLEVWQANAGGRYRHVKDGYLAPLDPNFGGCGRCLTDGDGYYFFRTVKPGAYPFRNSSNSWRMPISTSRSSAPGWRSG